jgi:SNF2 family DNA or RNA helicase
MVEEGAALLAIASRPPGRSVEITRSAAMDDGAWLELRAELGADGGAVNERFSLPSEMFLARLGRLRGVCQRRGVGIDWDASVADLVRAQQTRRRALEESRLAPRRLTEGEISELLDPSRHIRDLTDFQKRDLGRLLTLDGGANFSVPGAGKTAVTYALYEGERVRGRVERMLVVAPLSAFEAWTGEARLSLAPAPHVRAFEGWVPVRAEVLLVNYHRLHQSYERIAEWVAERPTMVVLDEAHRIKKGWRGLWGADSLSLALLAARRDILTGTPAPQGSRDLAALIDFVWPGSARTVLPQAALAASPPRHAFAEVAEAIRPLFVRTTKADLDLPEPVKEVIPVPLEPLHADIYDALRNQYQGALALDRQDRFALQRMGRITMYLLEAATNPALLATGSSDYDPREFRHPPFEIAPGSRLAELLARYGDYAMPRKFENVAQLVADNTAEDEKTLIWTNFVKNIESLEILLAELQPAIIHGGIPTGTAASGDRTRESELRRFRRDPGCQVLIANPAAAGEGISLHQVCHRAIYLDRTFNAGQFLQSVDRIHRLGLDREKETTIKLLVSEGTIDEVVDQRVFTKAERLGEMLDDPSILEMALPDDEDYGQPLDSVEDMDALLRHLRGDGDA